MTAARRAGRAARPGTRLTAAFYDRPTLDVARDLIGCRLVHETADGRTSGLIVETEAYIGEDDPACHAAAGRTARNAPLYGPPGTAYVYLNYGLHCLVNAVTEAEGRPAAVLIRALLPDNGLPLMRQRRMAVPWRRGRSEPPDAALCRGPGNLTVALGITLAANRQRLTHAPLWIEMADAAALPDGRVWTPRIGIRHGLDRLWRVAVADHPAVSGRRGAVR